MSQTVSTMINSLNSFKSFQEFINLPDTKNGSSDESILTARIEMPDGNLSLK